VSQYIQQQCRRGALLLLALVFALPASARDIVDVSSQLFLTRDETAGIQLPDADSGFDQISKLYTSVEFFGANFFIDGQLSKACDPSIGIPDVGTCVGAGGSPANYNQVITPLAVAYDANDFTESSVTQLRNLGVNIGQEANRTRIRPMMASWVYDTAEDTFAIADRSLGPVLADRPQTPRQGAFLDGLELSADRVDSLRGAEAP